MLVLAIAADWLNSAPAPGTVIAWQTDLADARKQAAARNAPILLYFTADWCGPCQRMRRTVYPRPDVKRLLQSHYVPVKIDMTGQPPGPTRVARRFAVRGYPTFLILDADGQLLSRHVGYLDAGRLTRWLDGIRAMLPAHQARTTRE